MPTRLRQQLFLFRVLFLLQVAQGEQGPENHLLLVETPQKPLA